MSEGRSTTKQVPCDCVTEEEMALDKLVAVARLQYPDTTWARLTCDGRPFVHVGDGGGLDLTFTGYGPVIEETAMGTARRMAEDYMAMAVAALAILGG